MTKNCSRCHTQKPLDDFHSAPRGRHKRQSRCKECSREEQRLYRQADPERFRERARNYTRNLRGQILEALGGACSECGYSANPLGLEIDHVNEDGAVDRKARINGTARHAYYLQLLRGIEAGDGPDLQVLCGTCHSIKTRLAKMK